MQRIDNMGLLGMSVPVVRPRDVDLADIVVRSRQAHPDPVAPPTRRATAAPVRRPVLPRQESRPAGAVAARRSRFTGDLGRLQDRDPELLAHLRRNPDQARALMAQLDRLMTAL